MASSCRIVPSNSKVQQMLLIYIPNLKFPLNVEVNLHKRRALTPLRSQWQQGFQRRYDSGLSQEYTGQGEQASNRSRSYNVSRIFIELVWWYLFHSPSSVVLGHGLTTSFSACSTGVLFSARSSIRGRNLVTSTKRPSRQNFWSAQHRCVKFPEWIDGQKHQIKNQSVFFALGTPLYWPSPKMARFTDFQMCFSRKGWFSQIDSWF